MILFNSYLHFPDILLYHVGRWLLLQLLSTDRGAVWRQTYVETAHFYTNKQVDHLIKETEVSVSSSYCNS